MKREEAIIYREIQRNAEMAISAIDTITDKIFDASLAMHVSREVLKYSEIRNRAVDKLLQGKTEIYKARPLSDAILKSGVQINTLLNISTGHIAEMMIRRSNKGMVDMCRILNKYPDLKGQATELAKEFIDFEERNITNLKKYL